MIDLAIGFAVGVVVAVVVPAVYNWTKSKLTTVESDVAKKL